MSPTPEKPPGRPPAFVFLDPDGRRWPRIRVLLVVMGAIALAAVVWFVYSLLVTPWLRVTPSVAKLKEELKAMQRPAEITTANPGVRQPTWLKYKRLAERGKLAPNRAFNERKGTLPQPGTGAPEVRLAYYGDWDASALTSLGAHADQLTHVAVERYSVRWEAAKTTLHEDLDAGLDGFAAAKGLILMPILGNVSASGNRVAESVEWLIQAAPEARAEFIEKLLEKILATKAGGLIVDFQFIDPTLSDALTAFYSELSAALRGKGREFWLSVPMGEDLASYQLEKLAHVTDRFLAVLHGENSDQDAPGPTASKEWFEGWLETALGYGEPAQWIAVLANGGFDWAEGNPRGISITFADAMARADYAGLDELRGEGLKITGPAFEPNLTYLDKAGVKHTVWFQDAITFLNQLSTARRRGFGGVAIDRLGGEDPAIWAALKIPPKIEAKELTPMEAITPGEEITSIGDGCVVGLNLEREPGRRYLEVDSDGYVRCTYTDFPTYATFFREGGGSGVRKVALTFDDGPDPTWTPLILDVLKREGVKATFFIVGSRAELYPYLVRRIVDEGHELGNHTYTHSNVATISGQQMRLELNATQRLIETVTGRSTLLFRPPYNADSHPTKFEEIRPLNLAQAMGYMIVLEDIDSLDWQRDGVENILERVKRERNAGGNMVLLHDAGGDRRQTLDALPQIIDYFQRRGDRIVPLHEMLGKTFADTMPPVGDTQQPLVRWVTGVGFRVFHALESFLWALLFVSTLLVLVRMILVLWLAARFPWRQVPVEDFQPPVTVLVAAYNEAKVIAATIRSVLATEYRGAIELLVVNDGSTDGTAAIVADLATREPRLRLLNQPNGGKASALERGLLDARHEILVLLDADTQFRPETIGQLVQPLRDEKVGAVSGHAKVGNPRSLIGRCQALEYICGFNLDRRAYATWNCITVAPGAISALRLAAVRAVGGLSHDTLAEDTDLTLSLHRAGWRVAYTPAALAYTEAPETFAALAKQRFRWAFGTMQCLWKHRDLTFSLRARALGFFSLPSIWFFQIFLVALTPLVDFGLIVSLLLGNGAAVVPYLLAYLAIDLVLAVVACVLEREPIWRAWVVFPMRFIYRVLLSYVIWKAIRRACVGALVGWGKLERTAGVDLELGRREQPARP